MKKILLYLFYPLAIFALRFIHYPSYNLALFVYIQILKNSFSIIKRINQNHHIHHIATVSVTGDCVKRLRKDV